jgi:hypothetical protein
MEQGCMTQNKERISQSEGTPFLEYPLLDAFGQMDDTQAAQDVLNGTYVPPGDTDPYVLQLFR